MNYKHLNAILLAFTLLFSATIVSCGDDDEDEQSTSSGSPFVGYWTIPNIYERTSGSRDIYNVLNMILFENGSLKYFMGSKYNTPQSGRWSYNAKTNTLVTDIQLGNLNLQWEITASGNNQWSGLSLWNDKNLANTAQPGNIDELTCLVLYDKKWSNNDKSSKITELTMGENSLPRLYPGYTLHWVDELGSEHNTQWGIKWQLDGQRFEYKATMNSGNKMLVLSDNSTGAFVKVSNPLSGDDKKMQLEASFPKMIVDYEIPGESTSYGLVHYPIWAAFAGKFSVK